MVNPPVVVGSVVFNFFFWQLAAAGLVVLVLAWVLNKTLIKAALVQFESWPAGSGVTEVAFVTKKGLPENLRQKISRSVARKFGPQTKVCFVTDTSIWGGLVIKAGDRVLDFGLRDRLRQALRW